MRFVSNAFSGGEAYRIYVKISLIVLHHAPFVRKFQRALFQLGVGLGVAQKKRMSLKDIKTFLNKYIANILIEGKDFVCMETRVSIYMNVEKSYMEIAFVNNLIPFPGI